eukprot:TRINITY_DN38744_c0_g1_i1.p1 TRINITY_DN38744_c0_g1~~TRINITY_DN38744_c0_g1_i1.p1  ORF type:complete len:516 (-),score=119.82 TRINITY_DN38744_c0_g1_i1:201-1748(-)
MEASVDLAACLGAPPGHVGIWVGCLQESHLRSRYGREWCAVLDAMGKASATAQSLKKPITHGTPYLGDQRIYIVVEGNFALGFLKVGKKTLFVAPPTHQGSASRRCDVKDDNFVEISPVCALDFYVTETRQRGGLGRKLFDAMLKGEGVVPAQMAYDRPSPKLIGFLGKHFGLVKYQPQNNNYVVFDDYFERASYTGPASRNPLVAAAAEKTAARQAAAAALAAKQAALGVEAAGGGGIHGTAGFAPSSAGSRRWEESSQQRLHGGQQQAHHHMSPPEMTMPGMLPAAGPAGDGAHSPRRLGEMTLQPQAATPWEQNAPGLPPRQPPAHEALAPRGGRQPQQGFGSAAPWDVASQAPSRRAPSPAAMSRHGGGAAAPWEQQAQMRTPSHKSSSSALQAPWGDDRGGAAGGRGGSMRPPRVAGNRRSPPGGMEYGGQQDARPPAGYNVAAGVRNGGAGARSASTPAGSSCGAVPGLSGSGSSLADIGGGSGRSAAGGGSRRYASPFSHAGSRLLAA